MIDLALIHATGIEIADQLLVGAALRVGGSRFFEDQLELVFGRFTCSPATAPARHRGRDRILSAPLAIGIFEKVFTWIGLQVHVRSDHTLKSAFGQRRRADEYTN